MIEVTSREDQLRTDDEEPNCRLWDKIILAVRGYDKADDWRTVTDDLKPQMRPGHKTTAIKGIYLGTCEIEDTGDGISFAEQLWTVRQEIAGAYTVRHTLREPTEAERVRFKRTASSTQNIRGAKKAHVKVVSNTRAYVELFDALWQGCEGATGAEIGRAHV